MFQAFVCLQFTKITIFVLGGKSIRIYRRKDKPEPDIYLKVTAK